jgi:3-oxoacyl-[acyl-carrier-protein] synthase III
MRYTRILGTGSYLPEKILTNADFEKTLDTTNEWIVERTGIHSRHIAHEDESSFTMAAIAAQRALDAAQIDKNKIGMIVVATVTQDTLFPSVATRLQYKLGINAAECPAFDLSAACSGFIYSLSIVDKYIKAGVVDYALVVGSEALSKFTDWSDRSTCVILADGAGAVVFGAADEPGVYSTHLHANGKYADLLYLDGSLYNNNVPRYMKMRGNEVFKVAVNKLSSLIDEVLAANNVQKEQIKWLIPHQANLRIIQATAKKLNIPMERVILTIGDQGNTSSASVPLALDIGVRDGRIQRGDIMLLEAFGGGFAWGAALIKY